MAVIYPKHNKEAETARTLLALADNPMDVKTITDSGLAFVVPEELYERYLASFEVPQETPADVERAARRPGRPRKVMPVAEQEGD
jgi:hypothetical protein